MADRAMKKLQTQLEAGHMAIGLIPKLGRAEMVVNSTGDDILAAAARLKSKGRRDDAVSAIQAARSGGNDATDEMWNSLLDQVIAKL